MIARSEPMRRLSTLSLPAAVEAVRLRVLELLREEYPDEDVRLDPFACGRPHVFRCRVQGRPVGPPVNLEDAVGAGMRRGREAAVRALADALSQRIMLYLQTAE